jgi:hypothetical protein
MWLIVMTDRSACDDACAQKLYFMRQIRVTQAGERHRLTMVWLRSDAGAIPPKVLEASRTRGGWSPIRPRSPHGCRPTRARRTAITSTWSIRTAT